MYHSGGNMIGGANTPFAFSSALIMFVIDAVVYAALAWYGEQVIPSEFGTTRAPCFCASYWTRRRTLPSSVGAAITASYDATAVPTTSIPLNDKQGTDWGVTEPVHARVADGGNLRIAGLRKVFDAKPCASGKDGGGLVAVDNLSLTMYEGQILSLLGHNGESTIIDDECSSLCIDDIDQPLCDA